MAEVYNIFKRVKKIGIYDFYYLKWIINNYNELQVYLTKDDIIYINHNIIRYISSIRTNIIKLLILKQDIKTLNFIVNIRAQLLKKLKGASILPLINLLFNNIDNNISFIYKVIDLYINDTEEVIEYMLYLSIEYNNIGITSYILENSNINIENNMDILEDCIIFGTIDMLKIILKYVSYINDTSLYLAIERNDKDILEVILDKYDNFSKEVFKTGYNIAEEYDNEENMELLERYIYI